MTDRDIHETCLYRTHSAFSADWRSVEVVERTHTRADQIEAQALADIKVLVGAERHRGSWTRNTGEGNKAGGLKCVGACFMWNMKYVRADTVGIEGLSFKNAFSFCRPLSRSNFHSRPVCSGKKF